MKKILSILSDIFVGVFQIAGLALHVYTIVMLYGLYGVFIAIIALFLPIISEIFCFFKSIAISNSILNNYTASVFILTGSLILSCICNILVEYLDKKEVEQMENKENNVQEDIEISGTDFDTMFANMDILELEDIVRNKKEQYRPEVYSIACKQFTERYNADPYIIEHANVEDVLQQIDNKRQRPMKWYYWLISVWIPVSIISIIFDLISAYENSFVLYADLILIAILVSSEIFIIQKKKLGLWFLCSFFIIEIIFKIFFAFIGQSAELLGSVLGFLVFTVLNYIYFYKRWHLFKD